MPNGDTHYPAVLVLYSNTEQLHAAAGCIATFLRERRFDAGMVDARGADIYDEMKKAIDAAKAVVCVTNETAYEQGSPVLKRELLHAARLVDNRQKPKSFVVCVAEGGPFPKTLYAQDFPFADILSKIEQSSNTSSTLNHFCDRISYTTAESDEISTEIQRARLDPHARVRPRTAEEHELTILMSLSGNAENEDLIALCLTMLMSGSFGNYVDQLRLNRVVDDDIQNRILQGVLTVLKDDIGLLKAFHAVAPNLQYCTDDIDALILNTPTGSLHNKATECHTRMRYHTDGTSFSFFDEATYLLHEGARRLWQLSLDRGRFIEDRNTVVAAKMLLDITEEAVETGIAGSVTSLSGPRLTDLKNSLEKVAASFANDHRNKALKRILPHCSLRYTPLIDTLKRNWQSFGRDYASSFSLSFLVVCVYFDLLLISPTDEHANIEGQFRKCVGHHLRTAATKRVTKLANDLILNYVELIQATMHHSLSRVSAAANAG